MAPTPEPTSLKMLKGTRPDRVNQHEPEPDGSVRCPSSLSDGARAVWERLAPDLIAKRVLTAWDVDDFAAFCDAVDRWDSACEHLSAEGEVIEAPVFNRNGECTGNRVVLSPWWQVWKSANDVMTRKAARFGLTPSDRSQLKVGDGRTDNPKARLLS